MAQISQGGKEGGVFSFFGKTIDSRTIRVIEGHQRGRPAPNQRTAQVLVIIEGDKKSKIESIDEALKNKTPKSAPNYL